MTDFILGHPLSTGLEGSEEGSSPPPVTPHSPAGVREVSNLGGVPSIQGGPPGLPAPGSYPHPSSGIHVVVLFTNVYGPFFSSSLVILSIFFFF